MRIEGKKKPLSPFSLPASQTPASGIYDDDDEKKKRRFGPPPLPQSPKSPKKGVVTGRKPDGEKKWGKLCPEEGGPRPKKNNNRGVTIRGWRVARLLPATEEGKQRRVEGDNGGRGLRRKKKE
jgi:hypothetical protein